MKLLFCSLSDRPILSQTIFESNQKYFDKYNFDFIYETKILTTQRHPAWSKILLLQRCLENDYDYIIWIDDDILITNYTIDFRDIINNYKPESIMVDDNNNIRPWKINTGIIVCKNNDTTKQMLNQIWDIANPKHYFGGVWENDTMNDYHIKNNSFTVCPHRTIQSFKQFHEDGDFSVHFAGISDIQKRIKFRNEYIKKIIK